MEENLEESVEELVDDHYLPSPPFPIRSQLDLYDYQIYRMPSSVCTMRVWRRSVLPHGREGP
ncbi:hypothetical protein GCM10010365_48760 [Streptomyces poonensis]|uniref:Uncharacterized protein n=1 Tax=Streptomyces poonensis TaxID=68255 RepID=A0A918UNH8_9ACTN|nr:hypothetical protein GCM10010365_48760 [Streptomyces poonensis]GLJ91860.1 hypothetical protein GCM10017589_44680 [Streptomyces poonensis]